MNKLALIAIATQPKFGDKGEWMGADIFYNIEAEVMEGEHKGVHRLGIRENISRTLARIISMYGFKDPDTGIHMKGVESSMRLFQKKFPNTGRDADTICEVIRLKMPRFMTKAAHGIYYSQNLRTGEINEWRPKVFLEQKIK